MTTRIRQCIVRLAIVAVAAAGLSARPATSSDFGVNPTIVLLSAAQTSRLLTLRNSSTSTIRFQAHAHAWDQLPNGETTLSETRDLVVFPPLVSVAAGEERRVRIGTVAGAGALERNYRIILEELPPHVAPGATPPAGLTVLTRLSIPVFVRPPTPKAQATLRDLRQRDGAVAFSIENTGNVHFLVAKVNVKAIGRNGLVVMNENVPGWYILAAGRRDFTVPMPPAACSQAASLIVEARIGHESVTDRLVIAQPSCGVPAP